MTAPDSPITVPGTLDTSTVEPTPDHVRILPPPGMQQHYARLLLAAAGDDPTLVEVNPPHFVVPLTVAEDAGLLEARNASPEVQLHDRTVPFPPLFPAQEAHKMTPLSPPGERALPVAPNAAYKGPGADPAEAPGGFLPQATDAVRSFDSTGEGIGDPQGQLAAGRRSDVGNDSLLDTYTNEFAVPGVLRERSVVPAEPHTGLAEAEVVDREARELDADQDNAEADTTRGDQPPADVDEPHAGASATDTQQGAVATPSAGSDGAKPAEPAELEGSYPLPAVVEPQPQSRTGEGWDDGVEDMTIDEIRTKLQAGELDRDRVRASEQAGRNRKGVLELVED